MRYGLVYAREEAPAMSLAYERHGTGPTLVLLHGVGHRRQAWNAVLDLLTPHRTVITVDLPGHGESPPLVTNGRPAIGAIVAELEAFFAELGLDRPHLAGNSLGGALALTAAARGRASTVTVLSPAGFWVSGWEFGYARAVFRIAQFTGQAARPLIPALSRSAAGRRLIEGAFVSKPSRMPPEQALADSLAFLAARDAMRAVFADRVPFTETIPPDVPVTIAWGDRDRMLPPRQARLARQRVPHARFAALPGCGHVPMTDDPVLVARVLLDGSARA
jgi:pimeloyl-ACP methyl ester carboxylesterase